MAESIMLIHNDSGLVKKGFYGFSWTFLFWGFWPAAFRSDLRVFIAGFFVWGFASFFTLGFGAILLNIIWGFIYNKYYTNGLLSSGYTLVENQPNEQEARAALGIGGARIASK